MLRLVADSALLEVRCDRPYDEQSPTHVRHPRDTLMATTDRALAGSLVRAVLAEMGS